MAPFLLWCAGGATATIPVHDSGHVQFTVSPGRRRVLVAAGVLGALAVAAGAFGAHGLSGRVEPRMLEVWETAARYHMWHVLALLGAAALESLWPRRLVAAACIAWIAGIVVFCGSLYLLVIAGIGVLGAITPIGGLAFIVGWVLLAAAAAGAGKEAG